MDLGFRQIYRKEKGGEAQKIRESHKLQGHQEEDFEKTVIAPETAFPSPDHHFLKLTEIHLHANEQTSFLYPFILPFIHPSTTP